MIRKLKPLIAGKTTAEQGKFYELKAREYLKRRGLKDFLPNYHSRFGEIDLIARDGDVLVFIEVRYRKNQSYGSAAASVEFYKQKKIIRTVQHFLQKKGLNNRMPCRFDVIGITGSDEKLEFQWIKNAF